MAGEKEELQLLRELKAGVPDRRQLEIFRELKALRQAPAQQQDAPAAPVPAPVLPEPTFPGGEGITMPIPAQGSVMAAPDQGAPLQPPQAQGRATIERLVAQQEGRQEGLSSPTEFLTSTGEFQPSEDLPEIGGQSAEELGIEPTTALKIAGAFIAEPDEERRAQILLTQIPEATARRTERGDIVVNVKDRDFFINRPGFSAQDVMEVLSVAGKVLPIVGGAGLGSAVLGTVGRVAGAGTTAAGLTAAEQAVSAGLGSDRPQGLADPLQTGAVVSAFEAIAPPAFQVLGRLARSAGLLTRGRGGTAALTDKAQNELRKAGVDPDTLSTQSARQLNQVFKEARTPEEAVRIARARSVNVPITRGQATQQTRQQALESAAERGALGEEAETVARAGREAQTAALREQAGRIQEGLGGAQVTAPGEGVLAVQRALAAGREDLRQSARAEFQQARESGAKIVATGMQKIQRDLVAGLSDFNPLTAPKTFGTINRLAPREVRGRPVRAFSTKFLENQRAQLSKLSRSSDEVEAAAARQAVRLFDDSVDDAIERGLFNGDLDAIARFRNARSIWAKMKKTYDENKVIREITKKQNGEFVLTPQEATNRLLGAGVVGSREGTTRAVEKLKTILEPDSSEWRAIKEEVFLRLLPEGEAFSGAKFASNIQKAEKSAPGLLRSVFTPAEWKEIRTLRDVAKDATVSRPGAVNRSNTEIARRILDSFGPLGRIVQATTSRLFAATNERARAQQAIRGITSPLPPPQPAIPVGAGGAAGAAIESARENR